MTTENIYRYVFDCRRIADGSSDLTFEEVQEAVRMAELGDPETVRREEDDALGNFSVELTDEAIRVLEAERVVVLNEGPYQIVIEA